MSSKTYTAILVAIASLGGLLYGYDLGIISSALLYLDKCVQLSEAQVGMLASAIMIGALASSVIGASANSSSGCVSKALEARSIAYNKFTCL